MVAVIVVVRCAMVMVIVGEMNRRRVMVVDAGAGVAPSPVR